MSADVIETVPTATSTFIAKQPNMTEQPWSMLMPPTPKSGQTYSLADKTKHKR
jgi:hypothetical protein